MRLQEVIERLNNLYEDYGNLEVWTDVPEDFSGPVDSINIECRRNNLIVWMIKE